MMLSEEGHIRVATLPNHLKQNNDFTKLWYEEVHLPPDQRLSPIFRLGRFLFMMMILLCITAQTTSWRTAFIEVQLLYRTGCLTACEELHFPELVCHKVSTSLKFRGNKYDELFVFPAPPDDTTLSNSDYRQCRYFAKKPKTYQTTPDGREERLQTCFSACTRASEVSNDDFEDDNRVACPTGSSETPTDLLCVSPDDPGEFWAGPNEVCADSEGKWCFSWLHLLIIICVANPLQIVAELLIIFILQLPSDEEEVECQQPAIKCGVQMLLVSLFGVSALLTVGPFIVQGRAGNPEVVWMTFIIVLVVDQIKNLLIQPIIWYVLIRRCGRVHPGIQEYNEEYLRQWPFQDSFMTQIQLAVADFMELRPVAYAIFGLVGFYSIFVLVDVFFGYLWASDNVALHTIYIIDMTILSFFVLEIILKTFAYGADFLYNIWNLADAAVVLVSFFFGIFLGRGNVKKLALLRILRLMRVLMVLRKVSEGRKRLKNMKRSAFGVEKVIEIIEDLQANKQVPQYLKDELNWVIEVILSNKLYDMAIDDDTVKGQGEVDAWLSSTNQTSVLAALPEHTGVDMMSTNMTVTNMSMSQLDIDGGGRTRAASQDGSTQSFIGGMGGRERKRSQRAKRSRRPSESRRQTGADLDRDASKLILQLYSLAKISGQEESQIEDVMRTLDEWSFDVILAAEICDIHFLPILFVRILSRYDTIRRFQFDFDILFAFLKKVQESFHPEVRFHNAAHVGDVLQTTHYFYKKGPLLRYLGDFDVFAGFFAALVCHYGHPGVTNQFLIKSRHPRAIRYNDSSVLENYTLSVVFGLLQDPALNFLGELKPWYHILRALLVDMILRMDIRFLTNELGMFRTKVSGEFSTDRPEDRQVLLSMTLRCADLAFAARPQPIYLRWMDRMMEEFFYQGDLEKQLGLPVSPFCDRDLTNQYKCQIGFIDVLVQPLLSAYIIVLLPNLQKDLLEEGLENNKKHLQTKMDSAYN
ncbi:unnamed protein product [Vitrella brassicaformis CCMP3155]|uniref:PDEase domain-containing protein n=3 Tax=Vitrella brassicaformis TaxID=1169539 RepID=A0A0G4E9P6_VITBC|nr:unnamed protein product [Vitrella brassicaformis CCMP3155]|eukprot:CEL92159.1 unnamed protein product [Vitrella brassicaformis CCMP3155]